MKILTYLFVQTLLLIYSTAYGQEETKPMKRLGIQEVSIQTGLFSEDGSIGTLSNFITISPQSILLNEIPVTYSPEKTYGFSSNSMFSALLGFQIRNKEKTAYKSNPLLRIGINYFTNTALSGNLDNEVRAPYDSLFSAGTPNAVYMESITSEDYRLNYITKQLRFDCSLVFRTNTENRFYLYAGLGITIGASIEAYTNVDKIDGYAIEVTSNYGTSVYYSPPSNKAETIQNNTNFGFSNSLPFGIDFKLGGKKRKFLNRFHLFYELKPGINSTSIPEYKIVTNIFVQQGFGMKMSW